MEKIKIKLPKDNRCPYIETKIIDKNNKERKIFVHGYLIGLELAFQLKKENKFHNLIIVTGDVGSGKSTLIEGMSALNAMNSGGKLTFDNISWSTEKFIEKTDREDNVGVPLWWDESIQGASGRSMAITSLGNKLKMAFVTKRFKKHTYYLAIDEINEYAWKLIKMADCWIHVKKIGLSRGYFQAFTHKNKIKFLYNAFKVYNKTWDSIEVRKVLPDCKGKFNNWNGIFLDQKQYDKMKLEETRQIEESVKITWKVEKIKALEMWARGEKLIDIANKLDMSESTMANWATDFRRILQS